MTWSAATLAPARVSAALADRVIVLGLGSALAYGAVEQGGFYRPQAIVMIIAVAVAAGARATLRRRPVPRPIAVAAGALVLFGAWAAVRAALDGDVSAGLPTTALACCVAAALVAATGLPEQQRRVLVVVVLTAAVGVAVSGWAGVAFHVEPLALPSSGLWRASSTLTYANATAAFLVVTLLVAVGVLPAGLPRTAVVAVLALGLVATLSRAGVVGLVVAAATSTLLIMGKPSLAEIGRRRYAHDQHPRVGVVVAVVVAAAGLLPSLPVGGPAHPGLAVAGVSVGGAVLVGGRRLRPGRLLAALGIVALAAAAVLAFVPAAREAASGIVSTRLTTASAERDDLTAVTAAQFRSAPLTGVGPGRLDLRYVDHTGHPVRAVFTHDEYLQTAAETGLVGVGLVAVALVALAAFGMRARHTACGAAAAAAVAGFAAHSTFDFLWHVPALPLLLAVCVPALVPALITDPKELP